MPRLLLVFMLVLAALAVPSPPVRADEMIFAPFDASPLEPSEKRLLQTALASTGDYHGALDGAWGPESRRALAAYAAREYDGAPLYVHTGALVLGFLAEVGAAGWDFDYLPDLDVSLALPLGRLMAPEAEAGGERRWSADGTLTVLTHGFDTAAEALDWHRAAETAGATGALTVQRAPDRYVTAGRLKDGRRFYTRSDRRGGRWATIYLAGDESESAALNLVASSIRPGPPDPWDVSGRGRLGEILRETASFLEASDAITVPAPEVTSLPRADTGVASTGTGFYVGPDTVVTAEHVVAGCSRVTLADGRPLAVLATDRDLDVAALRAPAPGRRWLALSGGRPRLGERVHAAGFPYYSIAGTSLNLTGGNVSALAGVDDDARFFSFTAPVQPGNSGGPLIDARGAVVGLVVARLSEDYIVEATGTLPQNINYAVDENALAGFLARSELATASGGLASFDTDEGVPDGFAQTVIPLVCE